MQGEGFMKTMTVSNIAPINHDQPFVARNSHKLYNKNKIDFVFILLVYFCPKKLIYFPLQIPFLTIQRKNIPEENNFWWERMNISSFFLIIVNIANIHC